MIRHTVLALIAATALVACAKSSGGKSDKDKKDGKPAAPTKAGNFQLLCGSSDTPEESTLYCVRLDTRTGDVKRILWDHIPVSQGSTKASGGPAGSYQLTCHSTHSSNASDFYCLRLNTDNGEMMLINLNKVGSLPEGVPAHTHSHAPPPDPMQVPGTQGMAPGSLGMPDPTAAPPPGPTGAAPPIPVPPTRQPPPRSPAPDKTPVVKPPPADPIAPAPPR